MDQPGVCGLQGALMEQEGMVMEGGEEVHLVVGLEGAA
jgi:hypothetical protein